MPSFGPAPQDETRCQVGDVIVECASAQSPALTRARVRAVQARLAVRSIDIEVPFPHAARQIGLAPFPIASWRGPDGRDVRKARAMPAAVVASPNGANGIVAGRIVVPSENALLGPVGGRIVPSGGSREKTLEIGRAHV